MQIILENIDLEPGLYLVGTPIGHLKDITLRALETLAGADMVFCEDTRVTGKLLNAYGIKATMAVYTDHSDEKVRQKILSAIYDDEKSIALVSDAGLPLISDPGYKLVKEAREKNIKVIAIPGASASLTALQISGLPTDSFVFAGFVPAKQKAREDFLSELEDYPQTLVFYETVPRLEKTLDTIGRLYGKRNCVIARELTKKFEETLSGDAETLLQKIKDHPIKGEVVLLVEGHFPEEVSKLDVERELKKALETLSVKEASSLVAKATGQSRKSVYDMALELKKA